MWGNEIMSTQDSELQSPLRLHIPKMENKTAQFKTSESPCPWLLHRRSSSDTKLQGDHSKWVPRPVGVGGRPLDSGFLCCGLKPVQSSRIILEFWGLCREPTASCLLF